MSNPSIGYVKLHRPGRFTIIFAIVLLVAVLVFYIIAVQYGLPTGWALYASFVVSPLLILCFGLLSKHRVVPRGQLPTGLATQLKELDAKWPLMKSGKGCRSWNRIELGLPRTISDISLMEKLESISIPEGLIEPEQILTSNPGSMLGCLFGVAFSLFFAFVAISAARFPLISSAFAWVIAIVLIFNAIQLVLGLPIIHRSRKLPEFLRRIGRRRMLSRPFVVGPGWVKFGSKVWRADRDMLLIRRKGYRLASSEIECMFAGPESRRCLTFSGVGDEEFQLLFRGWNFDEIRLEFIDSEIS
jgi:membrane protein implicated in regulation of membrane protease activity